MSKKIKKGIMLNKKMLGSFFAFVMAGVLFFNGCMPVLAGEEDGQELRVQEETVEEPEQRATEADVVKPTADNKKGIQGSDWNGPLTDDAFKDSLNHVFFNINLAELLHVSGESVSYEYNGKNYTFNYPLVYALKENVKEYRASGKAVIFQVQMQWSDDPAIQQLIIPSGRQPGHICYALNVDDAASREKISATYHFLMNTFGTSEYFVQNWILGNEVNADDYCHTGMNDKYKIIRNYALTYELFYEAQQTESPFAKTYLCLTNQWNFRSADVIGAKEYLDTFAFMESDKQWNLAFHAYPSPMEKPMWDISALETVCDDMDTSHITAANLHVLTDYVKNTYGSTHRIILSEQGIDSKQQGEAVQAAGIAYLYKAAAANDMVDAMIYVNLKDYGASSGWLESQKYMGLMDENGKKKASYDVFTYMNTPQAAQHIDSYLQYITPNGTGTPIASWNESILWKAPATTATMVSASCFAQMQPDGVSIWMGMGDNDAKATENVPLEYRWIANNGGQWIQITPWRICTSPSKASYTWYPEKKGSFVIVGEVRVAGNPSSVVQTNAMGVVLPSELTFTDIQGDEWFYPTVKSVYKKNLMTGKTAQTFAPYLNVQRAEFAKMLYVLAGQPQAAYVDSYQDVPNGAWFTTPVMWASDKGIVTGYKADSTFRPANAITREEMALMLFRYATKYGYDTSMRNDLSAFPDQGSVSSWAREAMEWAVGAGLIAGSQGYLVPQGTTPRAQAATIIDRFSNKYKIIS